MRQIRLTLYLLLGVFLGAVSALSFAETKPAIYTNPCPDTGSAYIIDGVPFCSLSSACQSKFGSGLWSGGNPALCGALGVGVVGSISYTVLQGGMYVCDGPEWTLNGQTCTRPDPNPCAATSGQTVEGWAEKGSGYSGSKCIGGCMWTQSVLLDLSNPQDERVAKDGKIWGPVSQTGTGQQCSASESTPNAPEPRPKDNPNKPPCGAGEGVIGTSTGKVLCLPEGNPDVRKPDVKKDDKLETFPDGSKKKTETITTRDPVTNNKDVAVNVTVTAGAGGGTMAGTPGTTTSSAQSTGQNGGTGGEGSGDGQCAKEPNSPMCKAGNVKAKGSYGEGQGAEIEAAKNELRQKFAEVKAQASAMFSGNLTGGAGSLPCYAPITVLGQQMSMCFTKNESSLGVIGGFVMLMAALGAAFIILRR